MIFREIGLTEIISIPSIHDDLTRYQMTQIII